MKRLSLYQPWHRPWACAAVLTFLACSSNSAGVSGGAAGASTSGGTSTHAGTASGGSAGVDASASGGASGGSGSAAAGGGAGGAFTAGTSGAAGTAGSGGQGPLIGNQDILVLGSSNELGTCWRAFLWQALKAAPIDNFDFVGGVTEGPDCGVPGYDKDLQAKSGIVISNLPASQYADWFTAHPPDLILMHFGGADILQNMPVAGVMQAYTTALEQARLVNPRVRLFIGQHTSMESDTCNDCDANVRALNAAIAAWAQQKSSDSSPVVAVDLYTGLDPATDTSDGIHLNESGSHKVADRFFAVLEPLFLP